MKCDSVLRCPASLAVGACSDHASGRACAQCLEGSYDDGTACESCDNVGEIVGPVIALCLAGSLCLVALSVFASKPVSPHRDTLMTAAICGTLCVASAQTLAAFGKVNIVWLEPLKSAKALMQIFTLDIGALRPGCWLGPVNAVLSYLCSLLLYPIAALALLVLLALNKFLGKRDVTLNHIINGEGMLLTAAYIAVTFLAAMPYQCQLNPDGSFSLLSYYHIECWGSTEHNVMLALSVPLFVVVLGFMAMVLWATRQYPARVTGIGGISFVKRFKFLFGRFNPESYYFALVMNMRNFLVGVIPVAMTGVTELQFISLALVICIYLVMQAKLWPWRTELANYLDAFLAVSLVVVLVVGSMLMEFDAEGGTEVLQIVMFITLISGVLAVLVITVKSLYPILRPQKTYGIFLSHHKSAAAVLSRWCKMMLAERSTDRVFLDSDDVNKLDAIIDTTAYDSKNVVVLLTAETLYRMWCAAEIASAYRAGTHIVLVSCDGASFSESLIEQLPTLWSEEQQATLATSGVTIPDIVAAYKYLSLQDMIELPRHGASIEVHQQAMDSIVSHCKGLNSSWAQRKKTVPGTSIAEDTSAKLFMLGDTDEPESGCCCRVLQSLLQGKLQEHIRLVQPREDISSSQSLREAFGRARSILVILTRGMLQQPAFVAALACVPEDSRGNLVPIKADEFFVYPDPTFWEDLLAGKIVSETTLESLSGTSLDEVSAACSKLFNVLALKFSSHGSEQIQSTETEVIAGRLKTMLKSVKKSGARASTASAKIISKQQTPAATGEHGGSTVAGASSASSGMMSNQQTSAANDEPGGTTVVDASSDDEVLLHGRF